MVYSGPWRTVNSLQMLRTQVNIAWPDRSKLSDGTIGDRAHSTTSDHYPHLVTGLGTIPVVTAFDLTQDPSHGVECAVIAEAIRVSRDYRVKYVIWDHRMYSSYPGGGLPSWQWRPYTGSPDPHINHMHVSVLDAPAADVATPWAIGVEDMTPDQAAQLAQVHAMVRADRWQWMTDRAGFIAAGGDPAVWDYAGGMGDNTEAHNLGQLKATVDQLAVDVATLVGRPGSTDGFSENEIRRFIREEIESTFIRAHYRVDPAV